MDKGRVVLFESQLGLPGQPDTLRLYEKAEKRYALGTVPKNLGFQGKIEVCGTE
jgi:hypothetical protein